MDLEKQFDEQLGKSISSELKTVNRLSDIATTALGKAFKDLEMAIGLQKNPIMVGKKPLSTADEIFMAIKDGSLLGKELGRVEKGFLKSVNTPPSIRTVIVGHFINDPSVIKQLAGKNVKEIKNLLKGKGYADDSIREIINQAKRNNLIDSAGVFKGSSKVKPSPAGGTTTTAGGATPKSPSFAEKLGVATGKYLAAIKDQLRKRRSWKQILKWGIGLGLTGALLWWMVKDSGEELPKDMPTTPPDDSTWLPCIRELLKNNEAQMVTLRNGTYGVFVKSQEFPDGIVFYSNGRVMDGTRKKMGSYRCKDGQTLVNEEQTTGDPLRNIDITWDGEQGGKEQPEAPRKTGGEPLYHDCSSKDFPFEFGCISPKIYEIQQCLGVKPAAQYKTKGYFGPRTRKALTDLRYDISNGITKEIYDSIINKCNPKETSTGDTTTSVDNKQGTSGDTTNNLPPIAPPPTPEQPIYNKVRLNDLIGSKNLVKKQNGKIVKWIGPELDGNDYYILNKFLTDQGYVQKKQREIGDKNDEDVRMKYKWKYEPKGE